MNASKEGGKNNKALTLEKQITFERCYCVIGVNVTELTR